MSVPIHERDGRHRRFGYLAVARSGTSDTRSTDRRYHRERPHPGERTTTAVTRGIDHEPHALVALSVTVGVLPALHVCFWLIRDNSVESPADPLTGLANRRGLDLQLTRLGAPDGPRDVMIIVIDLDAFKTVNDRYGHDVGDTVLRRTASRIVHTAPSSAVVARTGGEEFGGAISAPPAGAPHLADEIRRAIASAAEPPVTASLGVAIADRDQPRSVRAAMTAADTAMYEAKRAGGDRVAHH